MKISLIQSIFVMQRLKNSTNSEERRGTSLLHSIFILHLRRAILVIDSVFVAGKTRYAYSTHTHLLTTHICIKNDFTTIDRF